MVYLLLADGFEEIETMVTVDVLRRCDIEVEIMSVTGKRVVTGAHRVVTKADGLFRRTSVVDADAIILPGGMPGAQTLAANPMLRESLRRLNTKGHVIAAICAAPMVLGMAGILEGRHATCYPGFEKYLTGAICHLDRYVVEDNNIITACGPAAALPFAIAIVKRIAPEKVDRVLAEMCYNYQLR